jgi:uncharacterized protein YdhG (YjbR/CyaY superfamily)
MSPAAKKTPQSAKKPDGFTAEEKAAMRARVKELKGKAEGEEAVLAAIREMAPRDRKLAQRFHAIVTETAPDLMPKTWYGMPAYAKEGKVICYFRNAEKFKERYAMFGFNDTAKLDDGHMWPVAYALKEFTAAEERKLRTLVKKAAS